MKSLLLYSLVLLSISFRAHSLDDIEDSNNDYQNSNTALYSNLVDQNFENVSYQPTTIQMIQQNEQPSYCSCIPDVPIINGVQQVFVTVFQTVTVAPICSAVEPMSYSTTIEYIDCDTDTVENFSEEQSYSTTTEYVDCDTDTVENYSYSTYSVLPSYSTTTEYVDCDTDT
ncbi:hypothetical protein BB558_006726, partial [Smittium angustum]